ncbi:MAG: DNA alkylation repair protein [Phycisphaerales bacterium]|nr:DNA alkylation repair protein [Phycisphaerales bacterium]
MPEESGESRSVPKPSLVSAAVERLTALRDDVAAKEMAAYMRTTQPFLGVSATAREPIFDALCVEYAPADDRAYRASVLTLWNAGTAGRERDEAIRAVTMPPRSGTKMSPPVYGGPREFFYAACHYAVAFPEHHTPAHLPLFKRLVSDSGWWDVVDWVAKKVVGSALLQHRAGVTPVMRRWLVDDDLWIRRTAILCHLGHKEQTDEAMLFEFCLARAHETDFFIRKAIGWALREYARVNPDGVTSFLKRHRDKLSPLSFAEAGKHLGLAEDTSETGADDEPPSKPSTRKRPGSSVGKPKSSKKVKPPAKASKPAAPAKKRAAKGNGRSTGRGSKS